MMMQKMAALTLFLVVFPAAAKDAADADARAKAVAPYLDPQTICLVHVDGTRVPIDTLLAKVVEIAKLGEDEIAPLKQAAGQWVTDFTKAGGKDFYVVISLADLPQQPFFIVPLAEGADAAALGGLFGDKSPFKLEAVEKLDQVLFAGTRTALERVRRGQAAARPEVASAFAAAGNTAAQILLLPTADTRRALEEVWPSLPREFGGGPSTIVTHGLQWAVLGLEAPPQFALALVIQSQDAQAAQALRGLIEQALKLFGRQAGLRSNLPDVGRAAALLTPKLTDDRLTLTIDPQAPGADHLLAAIGSTLAEAARRKQSAENMKRLGLALHTYHDVHGQFPTIGNFKDGKPLLSWRVHILPYVGEENLYKEFHLDEPWDSEHNRQLIPRMPAVYRGTSLKNNLAGKTAFLAPVGSAMLFTGTAAVVRLKDVADGTSNTIMGIDADADRAVTWTKPDDLKIDPKEPAAGLFGGKRTGCNALFADGSVHFLPRTLNRKTLYALFTRNGQEVIASRDF